MCDSFYILLSDIAHGVINTSARCHTPMSLSHVTHQMSHFACVTHFALLTAAKQPPLKQQSIKYSSGWNILAVTFGGAANDYFTPQFVIDHKIAMVYRRNWAVKSGTNGAIKSAWNTAASDQRLVPTNTLHADLQ